MAVTAALLSSCGGAKTTTAEADKFDYTVEQFADLQILRYKVPGFEELTLKQKELIYYLTEAALEGRDILFDQNGKYNLRIRRMLEAVYTNYQGDKTTPDFKNMEVYLKRVWFSNGIHHHYGTEKFVPNFSQDFLKQAVLGIDAQLLPLSDGQTAEQLCAELFPVIFDPAIMSKRVNQADGEDPVSYTHLCVPKLCQMSMPLSMGTVSVVGMHPSVTILSTWLYTAITSFATYRFSIKNSLRVSSVV